MTKKFYIKQRYNPQSGYYYIASGKMTKKEAKAKENCLYGSNYMIPYDTEESYNKAIEDLKQSGESIR